MGAMTTTHTAAMEAILSLSPLTTETQNEAMTPYHMNHGHIAFTDKIT